MEKELNIIVNRESENIVNIESNFQENLDLLETEEIMPIILDLLNNSIRKIQRDVIQQEIGDREIQDIDNEETQEIAIKAKESVSQYIGNLFYEIINFVNNKDSEEPKNFDYSLIVYDEDEQNNKEVYETFHYGNFKKYEKLLSSFAIFKDVSDKLIENNSKEEVKKALKKTLNVMFANICNYIDEINK